MLASCLPLPTIITSFFFAYDDSSYLTLGGCLLGLLYSPSLLSVINNTHWCSISLSVRRVNRLALICSEMAHFNVLAFPMGIGP